MCSFYQVCFSTHFTRFVWYTIFRGQQPASNFNQNFHFTVYLLVKCLSSLNSNIGNWTFVLCWPFGIVRKLRKRRTLWHKKVSKRTTFCVDFLWFKMDVLFLWYKYRRTLQQQERRKKITLLCIFVSKNQPFIFELIYC